MDGVKGGCLGHSCSVVRRFEGFGFEAAGEVRIRGEGGDVRLRVREGDVSCIGVGHRMNSTTVGRWLGRGRTESEIF